MKKNIIICTLLFVLDRLSKWYAITHLGNIVAINSFCSLELVYNRGISWGMLQFDEPLLYFWLSCAIAALLAVFIWHTITHYEKGVTGIFEFMVITGALSNVIDRAWYHGVVDFIALRCESYSFPVFNLADVYVVLGIAGMLAFSRKRT